MYFTNPEALLTPITEVKTSIISYCEKKGHSKHLESKLIGMLERNSHIWDGNGFQRYDREKNKKHILVQLLAVPPFNLGNTTGKKSILIMNEFLHETYGEPFRLGLLEDMGDTFLPHHSVDPDEIIRRTCNTFNIHHKDIRGEFAKFSQLAKEDFDLMDIQKQAIAMLLSLQIAKSSKLSNLGDLLTPKFFQAVLQDNPEIAEQAAGAVVTAIQQKLDSI